MSTVCQFVSDLASSSMAPLTHRHRVMSTTCLSLTDVHAPQYASQHVIVRTTRVQQPSLGPSSVHLNEQKHSSSREKLPISTSIDREPGACLPAIDATLDLLHSHTELCKKIAKSLHGPDLVKVCCKRWEYEVILSFLSAFRRLQPMGYGQ